MKIDFPDKWVHLRKSNTEPIIRVYSEAQTMEEADAIGKKLGHTLGGICDQISCDKRIFHPDMSHCNSIAHCDRREWMPEGLKNTGGSFSRMTAKVLHSQIGRNVLTYVDDIIVKSTKQENHITDLQETFANFRQAGLKLNPKKCVFGVKKGKFLGCIVSTKGIEANPSKIEAILRMEPPSKIGRASCRERVSSPV